MSQPRYDAIAWYNRGNALQDLGRFDEAVISYDQAIALKPGLAEAYNNRGNALQNLKRLDEAVASYDRAAMLKPDYIEAYYNRGTALQSLMRFEAALASYDKAIAHKPDHAEAHNNRGAPLRELRRLDEAITSYDKAIALRPEFAEAHNNRGNVLHTLKRLDEALAGFDTAIALKPDFAMAHYNRANVLRDLMRLDEALASFDKAVVLKPDYIDAHYNQGHCFLLMGRFERGWPQYELRNWKADGVKPYLRPLWSGKEDIVGKTLFIYCEQGVGDTLQFCRYGKLVKALGASIIMSVQDSLLELLAQMKPDIGTIVGHNEIPSAFDYRCPMMSLPFALGTTLATIPEPARVVADQNLQKTWDARLPPRAKPRIGVVWNGNPEHKNDHNRSMDLATLSPLFSADAHWISLQKEIRQGDAALLRRLPQVAFFGDELKDFSTTAAIIDRLDLVITVDTAAAHLAGAMGKPVWILLPYVPDWRWLLDRDDSPWYPTARLFRQDETRVWDNVIARVKDELREFVQRHAAPSISA
jgi:tetratricopeptide (TPR) repeat protein